MRVAIYPDLLQVRDLRSFTGNLTLVIAPDTFQTDALNELKNPVYHFLQSIQDMYGIDRLGGLKGDVKLYIMSPVYAGSMEVRNMNPISRPYTLAVSGAFPDAFFADCLNELAATTKLILTASFYPDQWTVQNTNRIRRPRTLFINRASIPGSTAEAGYLSMLNTNFSVFIGRAFSVQWVLDGLLATLQERYLSAPSCRHFRVVRERFLRLIGWTMHGEIQAAPADICQLRPEPPGRGKAKCSAERVGARFR